MRMHIWWPERETFYLFIYSTIPILTLTATGTAVGYSGVVLPLMTNVTDDIVLTRDEIPLFASIAVIGQIVGSLLVSITLSYGRRFALAIANLVGVTGWIIIGTSRCMEQLFVGRTITGLAIGLTSPLGAVYIGEISTRRWTALLTSWCSVFTFVGITEVYLVGYLSRNWRIVAFVASIIPLFSLLAVLIILPESPRWLLMKGQKDKARAALLRIRGLRQENVKFQHEFTEMVRYSEQRNEVEMATPRMATPRYLTMDEPEESLNLCWKVNRITTILRLPEVWKPLLIVNTYFFIGQFAGVTVVNSYAVDIFSNTAENTDPFFYTLILGLVQLVSGIVHMSCSTVIGRRPFSIVSCAGMTFSLAGLTVHTEYFKSVLTPSLPIGFIITYMVSASLGTMIIPWALIGEAYPTKYVNVLGSVTSCFYAICTFVTVQTYPVIVNSSAAMPLLIFTVVAAVGTVFLALALPETLGKTKPEIEENFKKARSV